MSYGSASLSRGYPPLLPLLDLSRLQGLTDLHLLKGEENDKELLLCLEAEDGHDHCCLDWQVGVQTT